MLYRYLLVVLGLNQTLVLAFVPELSRLLGLSNNQQDLGLITLILNLNLISYWFGVKYWGNRISPLGLRSSTHLAVRGFVLANLAFYFCLYASDSPSLIAVALSRLMLGGFSSAFVILAHSQLSQAPSSQFAQLARTSGAISLGRLLGPAFALLPLASHYLLFSPSLLSLLALGICVFALPKTAKLNPAAQTETTSQTTPVAAQQRSQFKGIWLLALLTTSLASLVQYALLPWLYSLGYQALEASKVYASLLLYLSLLLLLYQFVLLPLLGRLPKQLPSILLLTLLGGVGLFSLSLHSWPQLIAALALLALAICGLPNWYSQLAYAAQSAMAFRAKRSAHLARAHTSGYLVGSALAGSCFYLQLPLVIPIGLFSLSMAALLVHLNQQAQQQLKLN